ncbi:hypothetical protein Tco_0928119 [Tanacetum coccineum]
MSGQQMLGENVTPVVTEEPHSHTEGETDDMETKEPKDKVEKEQEPERSTRAILISIVDASELTFEMDLFDLWKLGSSLDAVVEGLMMNMHNDDSIYTFQTCYGVTFVCGYAIIMLTWASVSRKILCYGVTSTTLLRCNTDSDGSSFHNEMCYGLNFASDYVVTFVMTILALIMLRCNLYGMVTP